MTWRRPKRDRCVWCRSEKATHKYRSHTIIGMTCVTRFKVAKVDLTDLSKASE